MADSEINIDELTCDQCARLFDAFADHVLEKLPTGVSVIVFVRRDSDGLVVQRGNTSAADALEVVTKSAIELRKDMT